jgi:LacI family transcriptional regulator
VSGDYNELSGYVGMKALLRRQVDAVFASSDMIAAGAMRAITEQGLNIPRDVAVVGFDDMPLAATTIPALTTVRQPIRELGRLGVQVLIDLISGTIPAPHQEVLPAQLIVRDSCGATSL